MHATRRSLLQLPLWAALAGCTTSPVVRGTPGPAAEPSAPTRSPEAAAAADWVAQFAALVDGVSASPGNWGADQQHTAWLVALRQQAVAHESRLVAADPVTGGPTAFPIPSEAGPSPAPATPDDVLALLGSKVAEGVPVLEDAVRSAGNAPGRLLYASIATAAAASLRPDLPPADGGAEPAPFPDPTVAGSVGLALNHVRALVRGLELGLGRLPRGDSLVKAGAGRLDGVRTLRNDLLAALSGDAPAGDSWDLPDPMSTPTEIVAAWAALETNVLDALGVVVAADAPDVDTWLAAMRGQVSWVQHWGARLPHWPGWVAP